jgi:integrase/recombinase XerD
VQPGVVVPVDPFEGREFDVGERLPSAITPLSAGIDTSTIALWLGHEQERTTRVYLHANLALKQRTLDRITPPNGHPDCYRAPDSILAFLDNL